MREPMIVIADLSVRYGALEAVRGLTLTVAAGEVFGMLGPNGAGKSSTLACVEGLMVIAPVARQLAGSPIEDKPVGAVPGTAGRSTPSQSPAPALA